MTESEKKTTTNSTKEVLITGAGSGIGRAIAKIFSANNYNVYLTGRTLQKLQAVKKELSGPAECIVCDQSKPSDIIALIKELSTLKADLSVLINNAAIYIPEAFQDACHNSWSEQISINLTGPVQLTQMLLPQIIKNRGAITNISSNLGLKPIEGTSAYSATKAAMNSWTQTLALEVAQHGVRVNAICPGLVDTPIHNFHGSDKPEDIELIQKLQKLQPIERMGEPLDIAQATYFVSSEQASWMTGALVPIDGGGVLTSRNV